MSRYLGLGWLLSLQTRLILASTAVVVLAVLVTGSVFVYRDRQEQRQERLRNLASATESFTVASLPMTSISGASVQPIDKTGVLVGSSEISQGTATGSGTPFHPGYRIVLMNDAGQVVSDPSGELSGVQVGTPETNPADAKRGYVTWTSHDIMTPNLTFVSSLSTANVVNLNGLRAVAVVDSSSLTADWLAVVPDLGLSALVGLPVALFAGVFVTRRVTGPLHRLTNAVEAMSRGDFDQRVDVRGRDEVATLASSFTVMAGRVKERDTQLRNLIANVSHDLRTPLTSIQGYAEALADGVAEPAGVGRAASIIRDEAQHASALLSNLLSLSEIDSGEVVVRQVEYELASIVDRCIRRLEPRAKQRGLEISVISTDLPLLVGDPEKVERAICNLVENAVKFAEKKISVRLTAEASAVTVAVVNDGPSISPEDAPFIFERFYRAQGPAAGTGLGLAIARELVELNGGGMALHSAMSPVEFRIVLPRVPAHS